MDPVGMFEEFRTFRRRPTSETDRGVALLGCAYLDNELRELLKSSFVSPLPRRLSKGLFEGTGPLATLSAKIDLAFSLGLLAADVHKAFHTIRRIRNELAHGYSQCNFDDPSICTRCSDLKSITYAAAASDGRQTFIRATVAILAYIYGNTRGTSHATVPTWNMPEVWAEMREGGQDPALLAVECLSALPANDEERSGRAS